MVDSQHGLGVVFLTTQDQEQSRLADLLYQEDLRGKGGQGLSFQMSVQEVQTPTGVTQNEVTPTRRAAIHPARLESG